MVNKEPWVGTCQWCGEPETVLTSNDELPEWTEGVACLSCEKSMLEEVQKTQQITEGARLDTIDDNILAAMLNTTEGE
jgi:hypothetical protein